MPAARTRQLRLDEHGTPLADADLVVVDLETTGTDPVREAITEIGAVRVRGGEVLGEFRTFVDPQRPIPAAIAALTGITDAQVRGAPTIDTALPMFLDFARGAALVAHNARFDIGFLRAQAARIDEPWPAPTVIDTLALARRAFGRDEVHNHRLATLAAHVGAAVAPDHRALSDARATVDVLHAIIERLGPAASTLEDLASAHRRVAPVQLRKKHLAHSVPSAPGVYRFMDRAGAVLYVGTSQNMRGRVRTYFTAAEKRRAVLDMLPRAESISTVECVSPLEASVLELREIAQHKPPANRHGLRPEKALWLRLEPPRTRRGTAADADDVRDATVLTGGGLRAARIARGEDDGSAHLGPLRSRHDVEPLRGALLASVRARSDADGATWHALLRAAMVSDPRMVVDHLAARMRRAVGCSRYEEAQSVRDLAQAYLAAFRRADRLRGIAACPLLIAARPGTATAVGPRGWEMIAVEHGRLRAAGLALPGEDPLGAVERMMQRAHGRGAGDDERSGAAADWSGAAADRSGTMAGTWAAPPEPAPLCQGHHQEAELLLDWLASPGVRIVQVHGTWASACSYACDDDVLAEAFRRAG